MDAWMGWAGRVGLGPHRHGLALLVRRHASGRRTRPARASIGGYSVLEADSLDALRGLLDGHPHLMMGEGAGIDIHELLELPGM